MGNRSGAWATDEEWMLLENLGDVSYGDTRLRDIPNIPPPTWYQILLSHSNGTNVDVESIGNPVVISYGRNVVRREGWVEPQSIAHTVANTVLQHGRLLELTTKDFLGAAGYTADRLPRERVTTYQRRIAYLRADGEIDGVEINPSSETDFWEFVGIVSDWRQASLILVDDGSLRAVWRGQEEDRINLEFLGDGVVELAIFEGGYVPDEYSRFTFVEAIKNIQHQGIAPV